MCGRMGVSDPWRDTREWEDGGERSLEVKDTLTRLLTATP